MNYSVYNIRLDLHKSASQASLITPKYDTKRKIVITLTENNKPYAIAEGCYAVFTAKKADGKVIYNDCVIEDNRVVYAFTEQTAATEGVMNCQIELYGTDSELISSPSFVLTVFPKVYDGEEEVESTNEFTALQKLITEVNDMLNDGALRGDDGVSVTNASVNESGELVMTLSDGNEITAGFVKGEKGDKGDPGPQGLKGDKGDKGETGPEGPQGIQGIQGIQGEVGPKGDTGPQGERGLRGEQGIQGIQGIPGETGPKGDTGPQGEQGIKGDTGDAGPKGDTGETGPQGETGPKGADGVSVSSVVQTTTANTDGGENVITVTLSNGSKSTFKVKNGTKGSTGAKGEPGKGLKVLGYYATPLLLESSVSDPEVGDTYGVGSAPPYNMYMWDGSSWVDNGQLQGASGEDGVSVTGAEINADGELILKFSDNDSVNVGRVVGEEGPQGPEGPKGDTGETGAAGATGPQGETGPKGADGVSVSSVTQTTTSSADGGENVITVTLSNGTKSTFKVKNGSKGSTGDQGPEGPEGPKGETGGEGPQGPKGDTGDAGVSVTKVEQTTTSNADGGTNVITVTLSNGQTFSFNVKNGSKGSAGDAGSDATVTKAAVEAVLTGDIATHTHSQYLTSHQDISGKLDKSGGAISGSLTVGNDTNYSTMKVRNIAIVAEGASAPAGGYGDMYFTYS